MGEWSVSGRDEIELGELREVELDITNGEAAITAAPGPARLELEVVHGRPVEVSCVDGVLRVVHRQRGLKIGVVRAPRCRLRVTAPPEIEASVRVIGATVVVAGVAGPVAIRAVTGPVFVDRVGGDLDIKTVSADVEAWRLQGAIQARSVSGTVTAGDVSSPSVSAHSVSGDLVFDCAVPLSGVSSLSTVSGRVMLRMPPAPTAEIRLRSLSGRVTSTLPLERGPERGSWSSTEPAAHHGAGTARIDVKSVSGQIALLERAAPT